MDDAPIGNLPAEMALMRLGFQPLLEAKPKPLKRRGQDVAREMRRLIDAFLASPRRASLSPDPPFDFDKVDQLLSGSDAEAKLQALRAAVPDPELADAIEQQATGMVTALQGSIPRTVRQDILETVVEPGSDLDVARFARMWSVAVDPMIVLRDLAEGSLTTDMVDAFAQFWPALYEVAKQTVSDAMSEMKTKRPNWEPEPRRDRLLRLFMGVPYVDPEVAADYQALFAQAAAQQAATPPAAQGETAPGASVKNLKTEDALQTPGQAQ